MKTIKINDKEYKVKYTIRALFIYEQITGKPFAINTLMDNYIFFYSLILANNLDDVLEWDTFIDALDEDNSIYEQFNQIVEEEEKKKKLLSPEVEDKDGVKKN